MHTLRILTQQLSFLREPLDQEPRSRRLRPEGRYEQEAPQGDCPCDLPPKRSGQSGSAPPPSSAYFLLGSLCKGALRAEPPQGDTFQGLLPDQPPLNNFLRESTRSCYNYARTRLGEQKINQ